MIQGPTAGTVRAATGADLGRACPYCRFTLKQGAAVVECASCHAVHHNDCWGDNAGCSITGCAGAGAGADAGAPPPPQPQQPGWTGAPTTVMPPMYGQQQPVYGQPVPPGQPIPPGQPQPPPMGRPARTAPALIIALLVLALAVAGGAVALVVSANKKDETSSDTASSEFDGGGSSSGGTSGGTGSSPGGTSGTDAPPDPPPEPTATGALPAVDDATMESDIEDVLIEYHQDLVNDDASSAWALTSDRYQRKKRAEAGFDDWAAGQLSVGNHIEPEGLDVTIIDKDEEEGVATVEATGMGWTDPKSPCSSWEGVTWARYQDGEWRYEPGYSMTSERRSEWEPQEERTLGWGCAG